MEANYVALIEQRDDGFHYSHYLRPGDDLFTDNVIAVFYGSLAAVHDRVSDLAKTIGGKKLPVLSEREISDTVTSLQGLSLTAEEAHREILRKLQENPPQPRPDAWYGIVSKVDGKFSHIYRRDLDTSLFSAVHIFHGPLADVQREATAFIAQHPHARPMNKYDLQTRIEQLHQHSASDKSRS